jgi:2-oxoacid:acceptor oxidoreductase gamma subunit (pyruvate/2-ketoisovalerate family)
MKEIRILSRGGKGAVTAAKIMVGAAIKAGKYAQAIPSFGQERKGAPVYTFARVSEEPITTHTYVYNPDSVVLFDPFLIELGIDPGEGFRPGAVLVANTDADCRDGVWARGFAILGRVDAWRITQEFLGNVPPNAAMLGAWAKTTGWLGIDAICDAMAEVMPGVKGEKNAVCARAAYERTVVDVR